MKKIHAFSVMVLAVSVFSASFITLGHHGPIESISMSTDGRIVVTGGGWPDPTLRMWDMRSAEVIKIIPFEGYVKAVAVSFDGRYVAGGGKRGVIYVWDIIKDEFLNAFVGHTYPISALAIDPTGRYLASGDTAGVMKIWKINRPGLYKNFFAHDSEITCLAFSSDGEFLASSSTDGRVKIWDYFYRDPVATIDVGKPVHGVVVVSPKILGKDEMLVITGDETGRLTVWTLQPKEGDEFIKTYVISKSFSVDAHNGPINAIATNGDGTYLVSVGQDGKIKLWDLLKLEFLRTVGTTPRPARAVSMTLDGRIAVGDIGGNLTLWRSSTGSVIRIFEGSPMVNDLDSENGITAVGYVDGSVKIFDERGRLVKVIEEHDRPVRVALMNDTLVTAGEDGRLFLWNVKNWELKRKLIRKGSPIIDVSKGDKFLATLDDKSNIKIWNVENEELYSLIISKHDVSKIALDERNGLVVTGDREGFIRVWSLEDGVILKSRRIGMFAVKAIAVDRLRGYIAVATDDGYVRILSPDLEELSVFKPLASNVSDLTFESQSGKVLLVGRDETVEIWNWKTRNIEDIMISNRDALTSLDQDEITGNVVAGGFLGMTHVWDHAGKPIMCFVGFADGEYAVSSDRGLELSEGLKIDRAVGLKIEESEKAKKCGFKPSERLEVIYEKPGSKIDRLSAFDGGVAVVSGKKIFIWDSETGKISRTLEFKDGISAVALSKNGDMVMGNVAGEVFIVHTDGSTVLLGRHFGKIYSVDWIENRGYPVSIGADDYMKIWGVNTESVDVERPYTLDVLRSGNEIAVGCRDGFVRIYSVDNGEELASHKAHEDYVVFVKDVKGKLITVSWDGTVKIWKEEDFKLEGSISLPKSVKYEAITLLDNDRIAIAEYGGVVDVFDLSSGRLVDRLETGKEISSMTLYGELLVIGFSDGVVKMYKGRDWMMDLYISDGGYAVLSRDGKYIESGVDLEKVARFYKISKGSKRPVDLTDLCEVDNLGFQ